MTDDRWPPVYDGGSQGTPSGWPPQYPPVQSYPPASEGQYSPRAAQPSATGQEQTVPRSSLGATESAAYGAPPAYNPYGTPQGAGMPPTFGGVPQVYGMRPVYGPVGPLRQPWYRRPAPVIAVAVAAALLVGGTATIIAFASSGGDASTAPVQQSSADGSDTPQQSDTPAEPTETYMESSTPAAVVEPSVAPSTIAPSTTAPPDAMATYQVHQQVGVVSGGSCTDHSYGQVQTFLANQDSCSLNRALYSAQVGGRPVAVSVAVVSVDDGDAAQQLATLGTQDGTGDVRTLVYDGVTYPGCPSTWASDYAYDAVVNGSQVEILEAMWADGGMTVDTDPQLGALLRAIAPELANQS